MSASSDPSREMVIRSVTPNITTLSLPFSRFGIIKIGGRATIGKGKDAFIADSEIVQLSSGGLAVFSPVALTAEVRSLLQSRGDDVRYITAPDMEHHMFLGDWHKAYPQARVIGPGELLAKRASQRHENIPFSSLFAKENKDSFRIGEDFDHDFDYEFVDGHANQELVFCYRPDRTLIQADLMFNLPATEQYSRSSSSSSSSGKVNWGPLTKMFIGMMNTSGSATWQKRVIWYGTSSKDRNSFNASIARINTWDFDRIIPCHGDVLESPGAKGIFQKVFDWHLKAAASASSKKE